MYETKAAASSIGVVGPLVALVVYALGMFGVDASVELAVVPAKVAAIVDNAVIVGGIVAGIYGRLRANKRISGVFVPKE